MPARQRYRVTHGPTDPSPGGEASPRRSLPTPRRPEPVRPRPPGPVESLPIEVVAEVEAPSLPGRVVLRESTDKALDALLADLYLHGLNCIRAFGSFQLAVPYSPLGELMLGRMMYDPTLREFPWPRTRVWLVQDPGLPADDDRSGVATLRDLLAEHAGIPVEQLHAVDWTAPDPAAAYAALLREHLGWREKGHDRLDAVMLELDPSGELGLAEPSAPGSLCEATAFEGRIGAALTYEMVNAARVVAVIPSRGRICDALATLDRRRPRRDRAPHTSVTPTSPSPPSSLPPTRLSPFAGDLRWYVGKDVIPA